MTPFQNGSTIAIAVWMASPASEATNFPPTIDPQLLRKLFARAGLEVVELDRFHELSFPYRFYLKKLLKSELLVSAILPFVRAALFVLPIKNKMLAVGRRI